MATTLDQLQIEINSNATSAYGALDRLSLSLYRLKSIAKGGVGLATTAGQIKRLAETLNSMTVPALKIQALVQSLKPLETLGKSNLGSTITALNRIPKLAAELGKTNLDSFANQIQRITVIMRPLADEMNKVAAGFSKFPTRIQQAINANEKLTTSNTKTTKSYRSLLSPLTAAIARTSLYVYAFKRVADTVASWIKTSNDYVENLNLFTVAMGDATEESLKYAQSVQDSLGIDMSEFIRSQGVFQQMAKGFGVANEQAAIMSRNLTQVGYDLSSLFNADTATSMEKLRAGLAGELEPLRAWGFALDKATLQQIAYDNGIKQNIDTMTQAQKSQLRFIAIMEQSKSAQGDMARTLESPANAIRIFQAQITQLARAVGNIFIPFLIKVMPYVQAFTKLLTAAANTIANIFGFKLPEFDYSSLNGSASAATDLDNGLSSANETAKELKKTILGFDQLNLMADQTASAAAGANSNAFDLGIDLSKYEYDFLGEASNRANEIYEKMTGWLARIKATPEMESLVESFKSIWQTLKDIGSKTGDWLSEVWSSGGKTVLPNISEAFGNILQTVSNLYDRYVELTKYLDSHNIHIGISPEEIGKTLENLSSAVRDITQSLEDLSAGDFTGFIKNLRKGLGELFPDINLFTDKHKSLLEKFTEMNKFDFSPFIVMVKSNVLAISFFVGFVKNFFDALKENFKTVGSAITYFAKSLESLFKLDFKGATENWEQGLETLRKTKEFSVLELIKKTLTDVDKGGAGRAFPALDNLQKGRPTQYAAGGFPDYGELFIAREAGAELVGSIGGRTAVANNDQIVEAVSAGVARAVSGVLGKSNGGTTNLTVQVGGKTLYQEVINAGQRANTRAGRTVVQVGV